MSRKDDFNLPSDRKGGGVRKFEQKTIKYGDGPSKNINKPKPKPTPKKENKVLKFLNEKVVKPVVDTADKYIVQPIVKGSEVLNDTIIRPVVNMIDNSISKNNEQHEKNKENSQKNQEAIRNYVKNEESRKYYHETIKKGKNS